MEEKDSGLLAHSLTPKKPARGEVLARKVGGDSQVIEKSAAGPVSRILSAELLRWDGHSSGPRIAAGL